MKGFLVFPVLIILLFGTPAFANFQKGLDAYESGDYATALKEWKPLADQGHVESISLHSFHLKFFHNTIDPPKLAVSNSA